MYRIYIHREDPKSKEYACSFFIIVYNKSGHFNLQVGDIGIWGKKTWLNSFKKKRCFMKIHHSITWKSLEAGAVRELVYTLFSHASEMANFE